jgi:hypothetical protein
LSRLGCRKVYGHDLQKDLPLCIDPSSYIPPLVSTFCSTLYYRQTRLSYTSVGDITNPLTLMTIVGGHTDVDLIALDCPLSIDETRNVVGILLRCPTFSRLIVRTRFDRTNTERWFSWCSRSSTVTWCHILNDTVDDCEVLVEITRAKYTSSQCTALAWPVANYTVGRFDHETWYTLSETLGISYRRTYCINVSELLVPLGIMKSGTAVEAARRAYDTFLRMVRSERDHPTYMEWTRVLHAAVVGYALAYCSVSTIVQWVKEEAPIVLKQRAGRPDISPTLSGELLHILTTRLPCILQHRLVPF